LGGLALHLRTVAYGFVEPATADFVTPDGRPRETDLAVTLRLFPFAADLDTRLWAENDWSVGDDGIAGGDGYPPRLKKSGCDFVDREICCFFSHSAAFCSSAFNVLAQKSTGSCAFGCLASSDTSCAAGPQERKGDVASVWWLRSLDPEKSKRLAESLELLLSRGSAPKPNKLSVSRNWSNTLLQMLDHSGSLFDFRIW
jgi:hypothetical protein